MKTIRKTVAFFLMLLISLTSVAQELSFEETVAYLKKNIIGRVMYPGGLDAYSRTKGYHLQNVNIEKNGSITLATEQKNGLNDFKISFNIFDLVQKVDYPEGIRAYKFLVHFGGLNVSEGYGITFATDADAERVARAFRYLKKVCVKEKDIFSEPTEEEKKPKLSREETVHYINQILSTVNAKVNLKDGKSKQLHLLYGDAALSYSASTKTYSIKYHEKTTYYYDPFKGQPSPTTDYFEYTKIKMGALRGFETIVSDDFSNSTGGAYPKGIRLLLSEKCLHSAEGSVAAMGIWIDPQQFPKETERLKKALLRLKELDSDEKDPFD